LAAYKSSPFIMFIRCRLFFWSYS